MIVLRYCQSVTLLWAAVDIAAAPGGAARRVRARGSDRDGEGDLRGRRVPAGALAYARAGRPHRKGAEHLKQ